MAYTLYHHKTRRYPSTATDTIYLELAPRIRPVHIPYIDYGMTSEYVAPKRTYSVPTTRFAFSYSDRDQYGVTDHWSPVRCGIASEYSA